MAMTNEPSTPGPWSVRQKSSTG